MNTQAKLMRDLEKFSKNYEKFNKYLIKEGHTSSKEEKAFLKMMDALEMILFELTIISLEAHKAGIKNNLK